MLRIVVVGQSLRGLIAAWVFRQHPAVTATVIGAHALGLHHLIDEVAPGSPSLRSLLQAVGAAHSAYRPRLATLRRGKLTRARKRGRLRLRFDAEDFALCLCEGSRPRTEYGWSVGPGEVKFEDQPPLPFDFLLLALPMPLCHGRVWFRTPADRPPHLHHVLISTPSSPYQLWEEIETKGTPAGVVTRILNHSSVCIVEATSNGEALNADLTYLFPRGFRVECVQNQRSWPRGTLPENVGAIPEAMPLGAAIDHSYDLLRRWTTQRRKESA